MAESEEGITPVPKSTLGVKLVTKDINMSVQHATRLRNTLVDVMFGQQGDKYKPMLRQFQGCKMSKR